MTSPGDANTHKVWIRWGSAGIRDEQQSCEYAFTSLAELNAFLLGVDESSGWLDYEQIDPNSDGSWPAEKEEDAEDEEGTG